MGQLAINGSLIAGPPTVGTGMFPSAVYNVQLGLSQTPRAFSRGTGVIQSQVQTGAPAFEPLSGVGPTDRVHFGDVLYFRCDGPLVLRISRVDPLAPLGPPIVELCAIQGLLIREFQPGSQLVLLEGQGSATIEYAITGS